MFNLCALSPKGILSLRKFHLKKDPFVRILSFQTNIFKEFVLQCRFYVRNIVSRNYSYWKYSCGEHFCQTNILEKSKNYFFLHQKYVLQKRCSPPQGCSVCELLPRHVPGGEDGESDDDDECDDNDEFNVDDDDVADL